MEVKLLSVDTRLERATKTGDQGDFAFRNLTPGEYTLVISASRI